MNSNHFIEQVQVLMFLQHRKLSRKSFLGGNQNNKYSWLSSERTPFPWISQNNEFLINQALKKVTSSQKLQAFKQLLIWLDYNPQTDYLKIPIVSLMILKGMENINYINQVTFERQQQFRKSLRGFSFRNRFINKVNPIDSSNNMACIPKRSVSFNLKLTE